MSEASGDPTVEQLLKRIQQLEAMGALVKRQQAEINTLKMRLDDLGRAFKYHCTHNADDFITIYDQLWPLVHKVFPGSVKAHRQIKQIMRNGGRSWDDKKPHG